MGIVRRGRCVLSNTLSTYGPHCAIHSHRLRIDYYPDRPHANLEPVRRLRAWAPFGLGERGGDDSEVVRFEEAFDDAVFPKETSRFLADDRHVLLLGYLDDRPAGFVSAVEVFHPDKQAELFLNEIGVIERHRRHGVAHALIEELRRLGRERGCAAIWVLTDEENGAAMTCTRARVEPGTATGR